MDNRTKTSQMISDPPVERNADGTFQKGVSGNPGGRPKRTPAEHDDAPDSAACCCRYWDPRWYM